MTDEDSPYRYDTARRMLSTRELPTYIAATTILQRRLPFSLVSLPAGTFVSENSDSRDENIEGDREA